MRKKSRIDAELTIKFGSRNEAKAVVDSLEPDNTFELKGLRVSVKSEGRKAMIKVRCERGVPSLINTMEDILGCIGVAEESISSLQRLDGRRQERIDKELMDRCFVAKPLKPGKDEKDMNECSGDSHVRVDLT